MYQEQRDAFVQTSRGLQLDFSRSYNSFGSSYGPLGYNWKHSYEYSVEINPVTKDVTLKEPTGREITFIRFEWGSTVEYTPPYGIHYRLEYDTLTDSCTLIKQDDTKYYFDSTHKLAYIKDRNGNQITLNYTGGVLQSVIDASGRELQLIYQGDQIYQLQSGSGETLATYEYYPNTNLKKATFADGSWVMYTYGGSGILEHRITEISNSDGVNRYFEYDTLGRVTANYGENDNQRVDLTYKTVCATCPRSLRTMVIRNENRDTSTYVSYWGPDRTRRFLAEVTNPRCGGCGVWYEYDGGGNISRIIYENGVEDSFAYDIRGNLIREVKAANRSIKQTTWYTYHPDFHLVTRKEIKSVAKPDSSHVITYQYDTKGNLLSVIDSGWVDPNGKYCVTINYLYNDFGQLWKIDGPKTDVGDSAIFVYYANGDLDSVKQYVSGDTILVVKDSLYDLLGNPQLIKDANGVKTRYFYDKKGRIYKTINGSGLSDSTVTQYTYNSYGNTKQITLPKGNTIKYNYDLANRLVSIVNGVNDSLKYSYDTENNRTREEVKSASGVLTRYEDYRYDNRNRLEKIIGPFNDTTFYRYDQVGNRVFQRNAKGDSVTYRYDDLNRLTTVIQWKNGDSLKTNYTYDSMNNLRTVIDADSNVTSYKYSDKGLLTEDSSSVTGITRYYYDPAGNLAKKKDSQGDSVLYSYDALNRLTQIGLQTPSQNIKYFYDGSSFYRKGRLYKEETPYDTITYSYKFTGLLSQEDKKIRGVTYTTAYNYDKNGNMTSLTYPKGRVLSYFYDNADRVDSLRGLFNRTTTRYITSMNYAPYGGPTSFTYGNGITTTIKYNYRYLVDSLATNYNVTKRKYYYDKTGNITRIADLLYPAKSESLYYDPLSRLTFALADSFPGDTIRYTYSNAGNRLIKVIGVDTTFYNYSNNKLVSTTGNEPAVYRYDNKGNVIVDSTSSKDTLAYDQLNRLMSINGGAKGSYYYDGEGKRIRKDYSNSYVVYLYDQWGNVIAETDISGNLMCEYIWANGKLIAKIYQDAFYPESFGEVGVESESPGPPPTFLEYVFYYHLDHLGTPLALTNVARSIQWSADYLPFGEIYNELIAPVSNEIRFPGQYHDRETGLHYNYFRYYNPQTGRYITPDPIGLEGGINLFVYVENQPLNWIDPTGLVDYDPKYINCIGYACGAGQYVQPSLGESLKAFLQHLGFQCKKVTKSSNCKCECNQDKMMVYIYTYKTNPSKKDPYSDPWIFGAGNDIHAIKEDKPGSWSYVPHAMPQPGTITKGLKDPDAYWKGTVPPAYCCCKTKK